MGKFFEKVYQVVRKIPKGKVATYGIIAEQIGVDPRIVGWALHQNPDPKNIPCHRVVAKNGKLAENFGFGGWRKQREKLLAEGVKFKNQLQVALEKSRAKL